MVVLIVQAFYQARVCSIAIFSSQIVTIPFVIVSVVIVAVSGSSLSAGAAKFELRRFVNDRSSANLSSHRPITLLPGHWMDSGMTWALAHIGLVSDIGGNGI